MKIITIQVRNFKNLPNGIYNFKNENIISGRNGSGKSSIAEAIIFCLYGRTKTGSNTSSDLIKRSEESCIVTIEFDTGTILTREESRFYGTKIQLNNTVIDQKDLDEHLPNHKVFMSIFLIGYFFSMNEADQRELILSLTDDVDLKELFIEVTRKPELLEKHLINFNQIDKELKLFKIKLKDLKTLVDHGKVQIDMLDTQIKNTKRPKKKINIENLENDLQIAKDVIEYNEAKDHNKKINKQIEIAKNGKCEYCGQNLDEKHIYKIVEELERNLKKLPVKPKSKSGDLYEIQNKIAEAKANNNLFEEFEEQILELQKQKTDKEDQMQKAQELIPELEEIVNALSPKGIKAMELRKKLDPILKDLNTDKNFEVKIETLEKLKTRDSYKEVFNVYLNDVPYKYLSTGERKLIDIKFAQLINSFNEINMFFLDDAELLSHNDNLTGQTFKALVTSNELKIETK